MVLVLLIEGGARREGGCIMHHQRAHAGVALFTLRLYVVARDKYKFPGTIAYMTN